MTMIKLLDRLTTLETTCFPLFLTIISDSILGLCHSVRLHSRTVTCPKLRSNCLLMPPNNTTKSQNAARIG